MKKTIGAWAALVLVVAATILGVVAIRSAEASVPSEQHARKSYCSNLGCGVIIHYSPDDGYDGAFLVRCNFGDPSSERLVNEGQSSKAVCADADQVYVGEGKEIGCFDGGGGFPTYYDATGWHKLYDGFQVTCVIRLD